ncbi:unnamed protein product [Acanthoscelides obtectus]|uniref:Uncharacterized protein n=1 Tax=Acanthoscelides obtectus TaxID=200917 RepID=A0A9P0PPY8_ACAOB|nr:unnamed protein product [Acanthoscelides obtectus]CAK1649829.1 hypothetical protein AOBTE_LOCUS16454 [Acanthoscelides obtectus]
MSRYRKCAVRGCQDRKPSTSASYQQLGEVCSVTTSQPGNLDVTTVEPIEDHYSETSSLKNRIWIIA